MITVQVTGAQDIEAYLHDLPDRIRAEGLVSVEDIIAELVSYTANDKLSGQVLQVQSGRLRNSLNGSAQIQGDLVVGTAGSYGVPYAGIQEYGGQTPAHDIFPNTAAALSFLWHGQSMIFSRVHHPGSKMPERSYLRSALLDMHDVILAELRDGVIRAVTK